MSHLRVSAPQDDAASHQQTIPPPSMVSRVQVADHSAHSHSRSHSQSQSRGAASVTSRTSRSRHQHSRAQSQSQSQHGGSRQPSVQNEFPFFAQSGDVEIVITCDGQGKKYLLHSFTLAQFSGFFADECQARVGPANGNAGSSSTRPGQPQVLSVIGEEFSHVSSTVGPSASEPHHLPLQVVPHRPRWRFELDWDDLDEDDEPELVQKTPQGASFAPSPLPPPVDRPRPERTHSTSFFRSVANLALSRNPASQSTASIALPTQTNTNPLLRDYDNLFLIFYNYAPTLNSTNIASAYSECKALLSLASLYSCLEVVGPRIDHHLLRFSSRLFKQIAKYPPSYLKLGYLARSRTIFSEALTHVVGQWPAAAPYLRADQDGTNGGYEVPQSVIDLIEDKVEDLEDLKLRIETKLFRLTLTTSRGERVNPSNDYLGWLAMSLWRQWLAENTTPEVRGILKHSPNSRPGTGNSNTAPIPTQSMPRLPPPRPSQERNMPPPPPYQPHAPVPVSPANTGRIFRLISSTNPDSYLSHDELRRFLKVQPTSSSTPLYSRDNLRRFERKIDEVKNIARDVVKPLTRNCLELDVRTLMGDGGGNGAGGGGGLGYLTCVRCEEVELPWD